MMTEAEWQRRVIAVAKEHGWLVCHVGKAQVRPGRTITPAATGFPDLVLVKPPRVLFLELKRDSGKARPEQIEWLRALQGCDEVAAYVARPSDAPRVLDLLSGPGR